jgi:hypothetical protein
MTSKMTFTVSLGNIDKESLEHLMEVMQIDPKQIKFVLDNLDNSKYRNLIKDFLNKEVTFAQLKKAVK